MLILSHNRRREASWCSNGFTGICNKCFNSEMGQKSATCDEYILSINSYILYIVYTGHLYMDRSEMLCLSSKNEVCLGNFLILT